jgi:hypothetical protein
MPPKALRFALLGVLGAICRLPNRSPDGEDGVGELLRNPLLPGLGEGDELPRNPLLPGLGEGDELPRNPLLPGLPGLGDGLPRNPLLPGLGAELPRNPLLAGGEFRNPPWGPALLRGARLERTPPPYC